MLTAVFDAYRVRSKFYYSVSREKSTFCYYSRITIRVTPVKHAGSKKRTVPNEKKCKSERHE